MGPERPPKSPRNCIWHCKYNVIALSCINVVWKYSHIIVGYIILEMRNTKQWHQTKRFKCFSKYWHTINGISMYPSNSIVLFGVLPGLKGNGFSISMFWLAFLGGVFTNPPNLQCSVQVFKLSSYDINRQDINKQGQLAKESLNN